jgi:hypothetical protein
LPPTATDLVRESSIDYFFKPPTDAVARLKQQVDSGATRLTYEAGDGYLRSVMQALRLPVDSQLFVYSKTSVQSIRINPKNPRAIYFGDSVALGYIRGADYLEFAAQDPRQGTIFYTLDQKPAEKPSISGATSARPATSASRRSKCQACLSQHCHVANREMLPQLGNAVVDHGPRSPSGGAATT